MSVLLSVTWVGERGTCGDGVWSELRRGRKVGKGAEAVEVRSYQYLWNFFLSNCRSSFTSGFREGFYVSLGFSFFFSSSFFF